MEGALHYEKPITTKGIFSNASSYQSHPSLQGEAIPPWRGGKHLNQAKPKA